MNSGRIIIIILHNIIYNLGQDINQEKNEEEANKETIEKEKVEKKITYASATNNYINPDFDDPSNKMIEDYIEKNYKTSELTDELDSFFSNYA